MAQLDRILEQYRSLMRGGRKTFAASQTHLFLVRKGVLASERSPWDDEFSFATHVGQAKPVDDEDDDVEHSGWIIVPVRKRDGGPFPERIGVGRARNCDVVLRFPSVSKLHAQFRVVTDIQSFQLVDLTSANGTQVNGKIIPPRTPSDVRAGDLLQFGSVQVALLDAGATFDLVESVAR